MTIHELTRRGILFDTDEGGIPGFDAGTETDFSQEELGGDPPVQEEEQAAAAPQTFTLTAEELDTRIKEGAKAGIQAIIKEAQEEQAKLQQQEAQRQQQAQAVYDPESAAISAVDARLDMFDEALSLYPDLPDDARQEIKSKLRSFKTAEQIQSAVSADLHKTIARDVMAKRMEAGVYTPTRFVSKTNPKAAPTGGSPGASVALQGIPKEFVEESKETFRALGLGEISEADIRKGWALQNGGR